MKRFYYTGILTILISISFAAFFFIVLSADAQNLPFNKSKLVGLKKFRVTEVHDGDTVSIRMSGFASIWVRTERVRLIGIDTPELKQEPWGRKAKKHLKEIISVSDWVVSVEMDVEERDKYGRLLAYLWDKNGVLINERMIEDGYAVLYTIPPNVKHSARFVEAQKKAQQRKIGIWGRRGLQQSPSDWRRQHKK